jgi:hypothetical protein
MPPLPRSDPGDLTEWQKQIADNMLISKLAIAGTHNSAASHISCEFMKLILKLSR